LSDSWKARIVSVIVSSVGMLDCSAVVARGALELFTPPAASIAAARQSDKAAPALLAEHGGGARLPCKPLPFFRLIAVA
jgi:hypothetical protein